MENKAKEKAIELVEKFGDKASDFCDEVIKSFEILNRNLDNVYKDIRTPVGISVYTNEYRKFWQSVKEEIKNLK